MGVLRIIRKIEQANQYFEEKQEEKYEQIDDSFQTVVVDEKFSIDVPSFLDPADGLSEDASLQYCNWDLDVSLQIVDQPKLEFIEGWEEGNDESTVFEDSYSILKEFAETCIDYMFENENNIEVSNIQYVKINGLNALTLNVSREKSVFKRLLYGCLAYIEGRDTLYQIIIFLKGESIHKLTDKMRHSIQSFKEL